MNHENRVRFYGYFQCKENIKKISINYIKKIKKTRFNKPNWGQKIYSVVLEFAEKGSLQHYYEKYKAQFKDKESLVPLDQKIVLKFVKQILSSLKYKDQMNLAHRDINPR